MKKKLLVIFFLLTGVLIYAQSIKEIAKTSINSTVSIVAVDKNMQALGYGSGFIISNNLIATNIHVVKKCQSAYVLINGSEKRLKVAGYVGIDNKNDLILLKVEDFVGKPLLLSDTDFPEIGERVYAIGNPKGLEGTFSEGIVSGKRVFEENEIIQITAPISPGSSGGPVINTRGEVIGIAFATMVKGQNLNFAIPVKYLNDLIDNISTLEPLSKLSDFGFEKPTKQNIYNEEGVEIKIIGSPNHADYIDYTIMNRTEYPVSHIRFIIIVYDSSGDVINCLEKNYDFAIPAHLAKSFHKEVDQSYGHNVKFRLLNYDVND